MQVSMANIAMKDDISEAEGRESIAERERIKEFNI